MFLFLNRQDNVNKRKRQMAKQKSIHLWAAFCLSVLLAAAVAQNTDADQEPSSAPTTPVNPLPAPPASAAPSGPSFAATSPLASNLNCPEDSITFELITGYVYSAPADMLDSQPGTLMLTDCIQACRQNSSCQSINYETGLCVLFSSNADSMPGNL